MEIDKLLVNGAAIQSIECEDAAEVIRVKQLPDT